MLFTLPGDFLFSDYFFIPLALHSGFSDLGRSPEALNSTLATSGCLLLSDISVTSLSHFVVSATILRGLFYTQGFFTLDFFSSFLCVGYSDMSRSTLSRICPYACCHRVIPCGPNMYLNYWFSSHKTVVLSIMQEATKCRVKNNQFIMFYQANASSKSYVKTSKHFEQALLVSTSHNCFLESIQQKLLRIQSTGYCLEKLMLLQSLI